MSNRLAEENSPYLLQHAENPVDWHPWGKEAFDRAGVEDKPVFLSIGYSTCHWCHVMAHESFEDPETAELLNRFFISIKVDKEERPDIDSIYMTVCQAFTGSGGWPTSVFMTPDQKPFFAGTYFPKTTRRGMIGFRELLVAIHEKWREDRDSLVSSAEGLVAQLSARENGAARVDEGLIDAAFAHYKRTFDSRHGGFGPAPKFPAPHNLLFLLAHYEKTGEEDALKMAETTLLQMYRGGLFDHIGYGFCRYSTDRHFLAPHFEKMLYDNALLMLAYCRAYEITRNVLYREIAEKTAAYVLREMTSPEGGFYSAQDADSEGEEGKYYLLEPHEIIAVLGKEAGAEFARRYDVTPDGNFEGKNIPNLLHTEGPYGGVDTGIQALYAYRRKRCDLHLDDKILTSWNALMIAAMCALYRANGRKKYLDAAKKARLFIKKLLYDDGRLHVSWRSGRRGKAGFLDDYAGYVYAMLWLYGATLDRDYLDEALDFCQKTGSLFLDREHGGYYLYSSESEPLILRPKETYDGAVPSGNSMMAYNLVWLYHITQDEGLKALMERQFGFMAAQMKRYPPGYAMCLAALSDRLDPPERMTIVLGPGADVAKLAQMIPSNAAVSVLKEPTEAYPLKGGDVTLYVCSTHSCLPPMSQTEFMENAGAGRR